jgi:hypothetical protein
MKTFRCACGARIFFENTRCLTCSRELGFVPDALDLVALEPADGQFRPADGEGLLRKCQNNVEHGVCNWMIDASDPAALCLACRLNNVIPDLSNPESRELWGEVERAKRRLVYSLSRLGLPILPKSEDAEQGLAFDIKAEDSSERVLTGHADGLITLNLAEADSVAREKTRVAMRERYRTLLGHFRHEVGHYYWERLVRDSEHLEPFRALFGDEQTDYAEALRRHYERPSTEGYQTDFISDYAASHPWEDWAETFAHYLHVLDTIETAQHFGFTTDVPRSASLTTLSSFEPLMREWLDLTVALNALNRSMGLPDPYPFMITDQVREKLEFVHHCVSERAAVAATSSVEQTEAVPSASVVSPGQDEPTLVTQAAQTGDESASVTAETR